MYAKIFESIYDGTLADNWQALVTFQQLLILCTADGVVDMTPAAISRRTGIPRDIIEAGIAHLEQPDAHSRSAAFEGVRITRLDEHRPWGWLIVNHAHYRALQVAEEKRENDRQRIAKKRANERQAATGCDMSQGVAGCRDASQEVAKVAYTDTDTNMGEREDAGADGRADDSKPPPASAEAPTGPVGSDIALPDGTDRDTWCLWLEQLIADGKADYARIRNASLQLWAVAKSGHDPTAVLSSAIARGHRDLLAVAATMKPSTPQPTTGAAHGARRESAADRAERLGNEAIERLGGDDDYDQHGP